MWTYLLFQLLNYLSALFAYYWFPDDLNGFCTSTWQCFLTLFDKPFKSDGGIGGFAKDDSKKEFMEEFFQLY